MFHLHPGAFGIGRDDPAEGRDRIHRIALAEARTATEHRSGAHNDLALANGLRESRRRLVTSDGPSVDLAACCA